MQQAIAKAKADCASESAVETARATFITTVKTAKDKLKTDIKALEKNGTQIAALTKTRNEAIRAANQDFKAKLKTARETLKAALPIE